MRRFAPACVIGGFLLGGVISAFLPQVASSVISALVLFVMSSLMLITTGQSLIAESALQRENRADIWFYVATVAFSTLAAIMAHSAVVAWPG